jgi:hypothetical protein
MNLIERIAVLEVALAEWHRAQTPDRLHAVVERIAGEALMQLREQRAEERDAVR